MTTPADLFLLADAALLDAVESVGPADWDTAAPRTLSRGRDQTIRDVVADQAHDEAWVPDVLAGRTIAEVGDAHGGDLLGADPRAAYRALNAAAGRAVRAITDPRATVHVTYGDLPAAVYLEHVTPYRALQAWALARAVGRDVALDPVLVEGVREQVMPGLDRWRAMGVFGPAVAVPDDADRRTRLLAATGYWAP